LPDYRLLLPESYRKRRRWRAVRALYRMVRTIWQEFRTPLIVFLAAVLVGGWAYGTLWNTIHADDPSLHKPYIDMPYTMVTLMLLASPDEMPTQPELVIFWYMMPAIGAYVAGRGIFDFANLFFVSNERHKSWEAAMASTYSGHVIVLGVGHLGTRVVHQLVRMGFDVVAIDVQETPEKSSELKRLDVPLVLGDGRLQQTLEQAGARRALALIVCTSNDQMNLEVTMRARDLNPSLRIVVRMWEERFAAQIQHFLNVDAVLSTTSLAAPSFAAAALGIEITQTLPINGEDYSLIRLTVAAGSFMDGKTIAELQHAENTDIVLHSVRGAEEVRVHPAPDAVVRAGDTLVLFAHHSKVTEIVARNRGQRVTSV